MKFVRRLLMWVLLLLGMNGCANAQSREYLEEKDPARHALVIGNSSYAALESLPSAKLDADRMAERLEQLRFKVTRAPLTSVRQLEDEVLPSFRKDIEPGDLVVIFFSGHGFTYGSSNFLAPTEMKLSVKALEVGDVAVSVENLQDYFERRNPGILLMLIDACRTIGGFVVAEPGSQNAVAKGIAEPRRGSRSVNTMIGFATRPGFIAIGSAASSQLSLFSSHLVDWIASQDDDFGSIFKEVSVAVLQGSGRVQQPGLFDWSNTNPFLNPTTVTYERERMSWQAALSSGKRAAIERFAMRNSVSRFASAARRWLIDNPEDSTTDRFTLISPAAVERAWRVDGDSNRVAIAPTFGGFAFDRSLPIRSGKGVGALADQDLGIVPSGQKAVQPDIQRLMKTFLAHSVVVATADIGASRSPSNLAKVDELIKAGSRVSVDRFEQIKPGAPILVGRVLGDTQPVYLPLTAKWANSAAPVELGRSLSELVLLPPAKGYRDVVDPEQVRARIAELKAQKKTITWVSIAVSPDPETAVYDGRLARATHAAYVTKRAGIDERRISSLLTADDVDGDGVRLRFFGY